VPILTVPVVYIAGDNDFDAGNIFYEAVSPTFPRSFLLRKKIEVHTSTYHTQERPKGVRQHNMCAYKHTYVCIHVC